VVLDLEISQDQGLDCPYRPSGHHPTPTALASSAATASTSSSVMASYSGAENI